MLRQKRKYSIIIMKPTVRIIMDHDYTIRLLLLGQQRSPGFELQDCVVGANPQDGPAVKGRVLACLTVSDRLS